MLQATKYETDVLFLFHETITHASNIPNIPSVAAKFSVWAC